MSALIPHLFLGLIAGLIFRAQTLALLVFAVLAEGATSFVFVDTFAALAWLLVSQIALQLGYLGGMYLRSVLERVGIIVVAQPGKRL